MSPTLFPAERRFKTVLTIFTAGFLGAAFSYELSPLIGPFTEFARHLPFVTNSVVKVTILMLGCLYAAGDLRRRLGVALIIILAHVVSLVAMAVILIFADTTAVAQVGNTTVPVSTILWGAVVLDAVITLLLVVFYLSARSEGAGYEVPPSGTHDLTPAEARLRFVLYALAGGFALATVIYEAGAFIPATRALFVEFPFVTNSVVKVATLGMLCFYAAHDLRRNQAVVGPVIAVHIVSIMAMLLYLVFFPGMAAVTVPVGNGTWVISDVLWGAILLDGGLAVLLFVLYQMAWQARHTAVADWSKLPADQRGPVFLRPMEFRTLVALADVVVHGENERVPPEDVAANVDRYIRPIYVKRRWVYRAVLVAIQLHPLLYLKAPFSELSAEARLKHLKDHFRRRVILKLIPDWWRQFVQAMIRVGKQLAYVGYYNDPRCYDDIGYKPFSQRQTPPPKSDVRLNVEDPTTVPDVIEAQVCIIGSGAAGAILAHQLRKQGKDVIILERGKYVNPKDFTEDEVDMMGKLYAEGVFQQTEDFRFTVLQGSCVGGTTVVNNAVSFPPPPAVIERWNRDFDSRIDVGALETSTAQVEQLISIQTQKPDILNPSSPPFVEWAEKETHGATALDVDIVKANIEDCLGCGYCNIGCAYGRKLSMLDRVLPEAQNGGGPGRVRILARAEVTRLRAISGNPTRILDARAKVTYDRKIHGIDMPVHRTVTVRADTFIVAAGAVASPYLLMQSGLGRRLPVGKGMSFNMGAPVTAEFDKKLDAYAGLQISHYGIPLAHRGFVFETWYNPPVAQAINMPGWFEEHFENMLKYDRLMAVGVLAGTESNAWLRQALTGGPGIEFKPTEADLHKLGDGLAQVADILFKAGAKRLLLNTWGEDQLTHPNQIPDIYRIVSDPSYITLGTGHPQGGNAISADPSRGVVDQRFRVHGYANLHVCDASVFPTSITVNPQLTVMALAHYAAARMAS